MRSLETDPPRSGAPGSLWLVAGLLTFPLLAAAAFAVHAAFPDFFASPFAAADSGLFQRLLVPDGTATGILLVVAGSLALGQLATLVLLRRLSSRLQTIERQAATGPRTDQQSPSARRYERELAMMADSVQRFLVWAKFHGLVGEIDWGRLQALYQEFCQLAGEEPVEASLLAKRLVQCGCDKPPLRWLYDDKGARTHRQQFYVIPDRQEAPDSAPDSALTAGDTGAESGAQKVSGQRSRRASRRRSAAAREQEHKLAA